MSETAKHTPGPWEAKGKSVRTTNHTTQGSAPNGYEGGICNCMGRRMGPRSGIDETAEANARLIAAAPEMLDALEEVLPHLERFGYADSSKMVRNAIAKAKGES